MSGQRGICAWMAYLVMRNESSRQRENLVDEEKRVAEEVRETGRMSDRLSHPEEGRKRD